jgi:hypothetical protein
MGIARLLPILSIVLTLAANAAEPVAFKRTVAGAEVDWNAGVVTSQAGSAADIRMPGPNAARPGAERRARAAAEAKLSAALHELGLNNLATEKTALDHAEVARIEYQSNGGVVLWLRLRFSDLVPAKAAQRALKIAAMPFEIAPMLVAGDKAARVASATYGPVSACPQDAIPVRRDEKGRLVLPPPSSDLIDSLAGLAVVIYLERPQP